MPVGQGFQTAMVIFEKYISSPFYLATKLECMRHCSLQNFFFFLQFIAQSKQVVPCADRQTMTTQNIRENEKAPSNNALCDARITLNH